MPSDSVARAVRMRGLRAGGAGCPPVVTVAVAIRCPLDVRAARRVVPAAERGVTTPGPEHADTCDCC